MGFGSVAGGKKREKMTVEENKAIPLRCGQVWGKGDLSLIDELAAPEIRVSYPLMPAPSDGPAADGKEGELRGEEDGLALLRQIGAIPA